jgi:hypothetical protein
MSLRPLSMLELSGAVAAALACALASAAGLVVVARPSHFAARLGAVEADADQAGKLLRQAPLQPAAAALCSSALSSEADALRAQLTGLAGGLGLQHPVVDIAPDPAPRPGRLAPLRIKISGAGSYEAVLGVVGRLAAVRPSVFVDTVDLTSRTSFIAFAVTGRVFCSAPR